ncbi:MAG: hypothetical protein KME03_12025 [Aphanocapsa lilacina HA4352-LM1]|jgi:Sec-independent protein translocase protein TatA|nr:hypothetical protein [Aphanocapsa lilacina HA4352-LM1]
MNRSRWPKSGVIVRGGLLATVLLPGAERWSWAQTAPGAGAAPFDFSWLIFLALGINALLLFGLAFVGSQLQALGHAMGERIQPLRQKVSQLADRMDGQQREIEGGGQRVQQLESKIQEVQKQLQMLRNPVESEPYRGITARSLQSRPPQTPPSDAESRPPLDATLSPSTIERIDFYNRALKLDDNTLTKEQIRSQWTAMRSMSMDMETYRVRREVYLCLNNRGVFYALSDDDTHYEVFLDPGFSVEQEAVEAAYEIEGSGNYIGSMVEPALFTIEGLGKRFKLRKKGRLISK